MLKVGCCTDLLVNMSYTVVINSVKGKGERIELYKNPEDYTVIDTYNSIAAYYRKTKEYYFGSELLIRRYLSAFNSCISISGELKQDNSFSKEGFVIKQTKENESLGIKSSVTLLNGVITEEEYSTPNFNISISSIKEQNLDVFVDPLNLNDYKIVSILSDFVDDGLPDVDYYSLDILKSRYPLDHIEDYDYVVVDSYEEAVERLDKWRNAKVKLKSVDIESTGLGMNVFGEDYITGVVLSYDWEPLGEIENSTYFPFRQKNFEYNLPLEFLEEIVRAINEQGLEVQILCHNGKMEIKSFWRDKLNIRMDVDTYSLSTLIDTRMERGLHTLKNRANQATGLFWLSLEQIFKDKVIRFDVLTPEIVKYYACPDTPNTIKVFKYLMKQLPSTEIGVLEVESKLQECKSCNEYYGLRLDQEKLVERLKDSEYMVNTLSDIFKKIHKTSKNINSADVLRDIVYNQLGCTVKVRTKKNKPSTSVDAISNIVKNGEIKNVDLSKVPEDIKGRDNKTVLIEGKDLKSNRYPSLVILAAYNKARKELGALRRLQKKSVKNRVMFGINGTGAASNRQTSDAHQYSDVMKELVLSDTPDHTLISADYSQVELRVLAYIIQDKKLIEKMRDKHIDIHRAFLSTITGIPVHMISAVARSNGKRVNFGVVYGISEYGLARDKHGVQYTEEQLLECAKAITDFYNGIPGCKKLAEDNRKFVFEHGYIETKVGYRRKFPEVFSADLDKRAKARIFRAANNTPVQGFAAHLMKRAELNYDAYIKNKGWNSTVEYMGEKFPLVRVMLSIHDEVLISAHKSIPNEEIVKMCKECMEIEVKDAPPFFAVPAFVENWYQGKSDAFEMSISMRDDILKAWEEGKRIVDWDNIVDSINKYKLSQIKNYMDGLIEKYKTKDEVVKNVTHPEYTHLLIPIYVPKDIVKSKSHYECIEIAVENYMNNVYNEDNLKEQYNEYAEDSIIKNSMDYLNDIEKYIEIDDTGEAILPEEVDSEFTEEDEYSIKDTYNESDGRFDTTTINVLYLGDSVLIDTSKIYVKEDLQNFHNEIIKLCEKDGYYKLNYMRGTAVMGTEYRMDYCEKEINEILERYKSGGNTT